MDPYRTSESTGMCPRCGATLEDDSGRLICLAGCGEWYSREQIEKLVPWHELDRAPRVTAEPWPWSPALCPICKHEMAVAFRNDVRFDRCSSHGVWLDAGEYDRFGVI